MLLKKIVVAEDDDAIAHLVAATLGDAGFLCLRAHDGDEAISLCRREAPDLLILDVMMPGLNGIEVFDRVRADPDVQNMPVLFVTAASKDYERQFADRRIAEVITKPFDLNDLLAKVRTLCPA